MSDRSSVTFAANSEYFVSSGTNKVRVWRAEDGKLMEPMSVEHVQCVASSRDGKWIAAGTYEGELVVWDATAYKQTFRTETVGVIRGLDFSPDATRLIALGDHTVTVWDLTTRERAVGPLNHGVRVLAAKYSPQGDRIATATQKFVRVYDSSRGSLLAEIRVPVSPCQYNAGLVWSDKHVFVISEGVIKQIDASQESALLEWPVPGISASSCITIPKHGRFIACSANKTVTFWDTSTHTQIGGVDHSRDITAIALSPDGRFLAYGVGAEHDKIVIKPLSRITEPSIRIDDAVLDLWKTDQLSNAEALLTDAISASHNSRHHLLAGRALVRAYMARLTSDQGDEAIFDAEESIKIQPSVIGYVAKSISLIGIGRKNEAYRACDIAFEHSHPTQISFLLLMKAVIVCMAGEHADAILRVDDLINTLNLNSVCHVVQAYMYYLLGNSCIDSHDYEGAMKSFQSAQDQLRRHWHTSQALSVISLISGWKFDCLHVGIRQGICDALYGVGRIKEAGESLLKVIHTVDDDVCVCRPDTAWVAGFLQRYLSAPESSDSSILLGEWAKSKLTLDSWRNALNASVTFLASRFAVYRVVCEQLELDRLSDAAECFNGMMDELGAEINQHHKLAGWARAFKRDLFQKLEDSGSTAINAGRYDDAVSLYSAALSLDPAAPQSLLIERSKAYVALGLCEEALSDANEAIKLDPSSPWGYEKKHAALHSAGSYDDAIRVFRTMLSKISDSDDEGIRERHHEYVDPSQTIAAINVAVQDAIRDSPTVLINTESGRLLDKSRQASLFRKLPVFKELISSMTTHIDHAHIQREVTQYYRYATFSHTWEANEPLFKHVIRIVVYNLPDTPTHSKLKTFCEIAREAGFHWAWSDTCCINKSDPIVLQGALVSMFKWYEGSAMTIVFLRGVRSPARPGDLVRSIWNTRAWTFQEYHASKVVRFYTEDWKPYLRPDIPNHKESREIILEMELATGVSARPLIGVRIGLLDIREKLRLASERKTTYLEDEAYSLLGIFDVAMPVVYGEGNKALGRLLERLLTSSGDTSVLAWTGKSGSFNSCLPASINVFSELPTTHIPPVTPSIAMETITSTIRPSSPDFTLVMNLYNRLHDLDVPSFSGQRMKLPCLAFKLGRVSPSTDAPGEVFRARAAALGIVEIKTTEDLSKLDSLTLVHPWIDYLLERHPVGRTAGTISDNTNHSSSIGGTPRSSSPSPSAWTFMRARTPRIGSIIGRALGAGETDSLRSPTPLSLSDRRIQVLRFVARLRQPFGALLLAPKLNVKAYGRIASESMITVQVMELTPKVLEKLIEGVGTLDVL